MEGEDDHTLDPGETVRLVQDAPADTPIVRVRTTDAAQLEGKIATSYLRRRTSIIGDTMESKPRPQHPSHTHISFCHTYHSHPAF